jgi:type IV pilus assembly protein PilY1
VLFNTVQPGATMCSVTRSRSYALNALTGLADDGTFSARLPGNEALVGLLLPDYQPAPLWLPLAVTHGARDAQGRIRQERAYALVSADAQGQARAMASLKTVRRAGRLSWREIANWRELHEAAK